MPTPLNTPCHLFVLPWSSLELLGGVNQVVFSLAHAMQRSGKARPLVLVCDWDTPQPVWQMVHGVQTVSWRVRPLPTEAGIKEKLIFFAWMRRFMPAFERFCQTQKVATINLHYPGEVAFTLQGAVQRFRQPIPFVYSFHGSDIAHLQAAMPKIKAQWRALLLRADRIVVCSADLGRRVVQALGEGFSLQLIYNGIDVDSFSSPTAVGDNPQRMAGRIVLNVGKFVHLKGQDVLIRAFGLVARDYPDLQLVLVGETRSALAALQQLCEQEGIQKRVHFFTDVPHQQVAKFFDQAHIFCLPSRQEAFPLVLLEAGAFALPVVASNVGGISELIEDGVSGMLVAPENEAALAQCLRKLLDSPQLGKQMGAQLHLNVVANFSWTRALEQYMAPQLLPVQDSPELKGNRQEIKT